VQFWPVHQLVALLDKIRNIANIKAKSRKLRPLHSPNCIPP